ncbi:MAG: hypothetical protein ACI9GK_003532, partial [Devosia sp.]
MIQNTGEQPARRPLLAMQQVTQAYSLPRASLFAAPDSF